MDIITISTRHLVEVKYTSAVKNEKKVKWNRKKNTYLVSQRLNCTLD